MGWNAAVHYCAALLSSALLINTGPSSLWDISSANHRSRRISLFLPLPGESLMPPLLSQTNAVCSHPVNYINPNLGSALDAPFITGSKNTHEQLHTRLDTHSVWSIVVFRVSPWKQPVQQRSHCSPLIHSFPLFSVSCWFWLSFPGQGQFPVGCRPAFVLSVALSSLTQIFCNNSNFFSVWKSPPHRHGGFFGFFKLEIVSVSVWYRYWECLVINTLCPKSANNAFCPFCHEARL